MEGRCVSLSLDVLFRYYRLFPLIDPFSKNFIYFIVLSLLLLLLFRFCEDESFERESGMNEIF